jgi:hypothetical protein
MAKKKITVIEYRYDIADPWIEYCRTSVASMISHYVYNAQIENSGAIVRYRKLV